MVGLVHLNRLVLRNGMFWRNYGNSSILSPARRSEVVFQALEFLVYEAHPDENLKITSHPAKDTIDRILVEVVDAATRFADTFPVPPNSWESRHLAAQGISDPPTREDSDANAEEQRSFIDRAHASTRLGRELTPNVFAALFVAIVDAREIFLADERLAQQDASRHSPLAQAVDRFKAAAWWWYKAKIPVDGLGFLNLRRTAKTIAMRMGSEVVDNGSIRENQPAPYDFLYVAYKFRDLS